MEHITDFTANDSYDTLNPDTYTAQRLKHASPGHLNRTTRRFFIGPIPEGWLNSNRKSWYKKRLELSNYSSRRATFTAAANDVHRRTLTGLDGLSAAARLGFSFPQPADLDDSETESHPSEADDDGDIETMAVEPVATNAEMPQILGIADEDDVPQPKIVATPQDKGLKPPPERGRRLLPQSQRDSRSPAAQTFVTAREEPQAQRGIDSITSSPQAAGQQHVNDDRRLSVSTPENPFLTPSTNRNVSLGDTSSTTSLLPEPAKPAGPVTPGSLQQSMTHQDPAPVDSGDTQLDPVRRIKTGVRFKVGEQVTQQQQKLGRRVNSASQRARRARLGRDTLQEGSIVKMEKMLVRVDMTLQQLPDDFDENDSIKTEMRVLEKWREFMVVARRSSTDEADFRLQMYQTRVIPEVQNESVKKKPKREVMLNPRTTRVNLYSSLDKTVVIWHPYRHGTRTLIMRPRSAAHSVEWYTFLRDILGWARPSSVQTNVPDLDVTLRLEKPFAGLEDVRASMESADENTALAKTLEEERAVAGKIIRQCMDMLERDPEWAHVLETWSKTQKMGLAWKRYDRLEWIHGVNEQKMYGSMAMERSYDLELRPKQHYPTHAHGKKGKIHEEPMPIEGFLIRLTSQKGRHQRYGKAFYKRLYFSTHNQYLVFNRPAKITPPHPPRLPTISGTNIPSSSEIVKQSPHMYEVEPFPLHDGKISWLKSGNADHIRMRDRAAFEESQRNLANLRECDGFIDMCHIIKVRKMRWGASDADPALESGDDSDVEFHQSVPDSRREDGETKKLDDDRIFELVLDNGLLVRFQAYDNHARAEWISRLRGLVRYWKRRTRADMDLFKATRQANLALLGIDEQMEAVVGQFARKWEVSHTEASPLLYHLCGISNCRPLAMSGLLYRKPRRRGTFLRCAVLLTGGELLTFHSASRRLTGEPVRHIQHERLDRVRLRDTYVYSGLITQDDLLYQNQTFDSNHPGVGGRALPRVYLDDGWTSSDEDSMTCFVVWMPRRKGLFRMPTVVDGGGARKSGGAGESVERTKRKLRSVSALGVPGRGVVFKCRSRAERDHWVSALAVEGGRVQEEVDEEVRLQGGKGRGKVEEVERA